MRILHLVGRSQRRGAEMVALELGRELDALGHSNRVIALTTGFDGGRDPAIEPLASVREVGSHHIPRLAWRLRRALAREPVDVVLLHGGSAAQVAAVALPGRGGPLLVWQRILGFPPAVWNPIQRHWWARVANRMDAAIALTPDLGVELRRLGYLGPLWHIANYRTPERFVNVDRATAARRLRGEVGVFDDDVHLIGFVGHLVEQKQPLRALDVLEAVLKHGERAHLVVAGDGPLRARLEHEIAIRDLGRDVTLLGQRDDVELVYAGVEVTLLTSDAEGIPGVVIEAQMAGCPVVSFPLGGVRDVVIENETGVVLPRFDTTLMADAVGALLADPVRRASMGARARARAPEFSTVRAAHVYDERLRELVAPRAPASGLRIYWYWPFAREENRELADSVLQPGDTLVMETLDRVGVPTWDPADPYVVINDAPEVRPVPERTVRWVGSRAWTYVSRVVHRRRTLRRGGFDVVHVMFMNRFTDPLDLALLRRRYSVVCSVHDVVPHDPRLSPGVERWLARRLFRSAGLLLVHNEQLRELLTTEFGIDPARIELVPHLVPRFAGSPDRDADQPPMILFFGTMRRNKGVQHLIDAIGRIDGDLRFHFAGRGADDVEDAVRLLARADPRVTAELQWIDAERKTELFRRASIVVLPYTSFGSESGVLHDAYGHGKPVVVSDFDSLGGAVRADGTGWVVPPADPAALAAGIQAAVGDPVAYRRAVDAVQRVAEQRGPAVIGARLRDLYERVHPR